MQRLPAFLLVSLLWAAIYLPALGSLEIKGEEGRRILPAVAMLDTGNFVVPQIGSEPYFRKPPLVNWLVAGSFRIFGTRNEWTARLPSALCVLAVALAFVTVAQRTLGAGAALAAAVMWLTSFGIIEKGRLIEIEALYVSLFGLATICWLSWWSERRSPWLTWIVPWIFLGLALLAKGPLHLLFFYGLVVAVLLAARDLRKLWQPAHLVGMAVMLALFAAWAVPCLQQMHSSPVAQTWSRQLSGRLGASDFKLGSWLMNVPRALGYLLPWTLVLPFLRPRFRSDAEATFARALLWGIAVPFLLVIFLPSALPRYVMPLLVPAVWLLAFTGRDAEWRWRDRRFPSGISARAVKAVAVVTSLSLLLYAVLLVPHLQKRSKVRTMASAIDAALPRGETLFAIDPDYQPFLFYLRSKLIYVSATAEVPLDARFVLVQPENEQRLTTEQRWAPRRASVILKSTDYRGRSVLLFAIR